MAKHTLTTKAHWGLSMEKFFYFFMGLRKGEIRKQVQMMKEHPHDEDPEQLSRNREAGALLYSMPVPRHTVAEKQPLSGRLAKRLAFTACRFHVAGVSQRAAFSHALIDGHAVTEFETSGKAAGEVRNLYDWIETQW